MAKAATDTASAETHVLTFPALLLSLVDQTDPVRVGNTEVYRVTVVNQGSGPDQDVKLTCTLPDQFSFVDATGAGSGNADGSTVTLGPIEKLAPNEQAA